MADIIQLRRDTYDNWILINPTLAEGEIGIEIDTRYMKLGDGLTEWNLLEYIDGVTDHSQLTNLDADDHTQYLNETRHNDLDHTGLTGIPEPYTLPTASTTVLGGVKVDGTTVTITDGVITSVGSGDSHNPVTVSDSTSIDLTITEQELSASAIFGTTSGTISEGNHNHSSLYQPLDQQLTDLAGLSYSGNGGKVIAVTSGADGFELVTPSSGGGGTWGSITGTLSNQTDLQTALNTKMTQVDTPKIVTSASAPSTPATGDLWVDTATAFNAGQSMLVAETVVSGSAVTSVTFNGLDGNAHGGYFLIAYGRNATATTSSLRLTINNDTTNSNYNYRHIYKAAADSTAPLGIGADGSVPTNNAGHMIANIDFYSEITINTNQLSTIITTRDCYGAGSVSNRTTKYLQPNNVVRIDITAAVANSISAGSTFRLYRRK